MGERVGRWIYALEALIIGLPTLAFSIPMLLLGLFLAVAFVVTLDFATLKVLLTDGWSQSLSDFVGITVMVSGGISGLIAWFVLSGVYLTGGRVALREVGGHWWLALGAGVAVVTWLLCWMGWDEIRKLRLSWFLGPALILPALHLFYLRLRSPR